MRPVARVGDAHVCPRKGHGKGTIVSGGTGIVEGSAVARVGDKLSCGCTIIQGSSIAQDNGQPIAYVGCKTSSGGQIISGATYAKVQP